MSPVKLQKLASSGRRLNIVCKGPGFWWTTVGPCLSMDTLLRALAPAYPFTGLEKKEQDTEEKRVY